MKNVIITGASGFLGTATVKLFLDKGYKVMAFVHDRGSSAIPANANLHLFSEDLTDGAKVSSVVDEIIQTHGNIHGCLLLAGGYAGGDPENTSVEMIRQQISMNFETAYNVVQPVYAHMKRQKEGRIVLIGSQPALIAKKGTWSLPYALSKSLLFQLASILNEDAKGSTVSVSVVVPSTIDTDANRKSMPDADFSKWVKPEQIAETMELLCSGITDAWREPIIKVYNNTF
jgi:NAD(P)-dependent dehydrogenase (short-subunit alcohol dehydrogenase family)